ncbi:hypothetical protein JCM10449v2_004930 [Rhodotorula kratochvilovae]
MDPSPSSSAPPPPRACLASLPLELIKQIVAEVNEQDNAAFSITWATHAEGSAYGPRRPVPGKGDPLPTRREDPGIDTVWSYWYGMGIVALSYVDKQLRALALPHLVETMSIKQTTRPFALDELHRSPIASLIRKLDFRDDDEEPSLLGTVAVLHALDRVDELELGAETSTRLQSDVGTTGALLAERGLVRQAFATLAPRLKTLEIHPHDWDGACDLLKLLSSPAALRVLRVETFENPFERDLQAIRTLLASLAVEELVIGDMTQDWDEEHGETAPQTIDASWAGFKMPTVTRFTFRCCSPLPDGFLKLVAQSFPNLEHLSLAIMDATAEQSEPTRGLSPQHLPHLRTITLDWALAASPAFFQRLFHSLPSSPVATLSLRDSSPLDSTTATSTLKSAFPSAVAFPPTLRHIILPFHPLPSSSDPDPPSAWAQERGVRLSFGEPLSDWRDVRPERSRSYGSVISEAEVLDTLHDSTREALKWGLERAAALRRVGDEAGLLELEAICGSLRERRYIEKT